MENIKLFCVSLGCDKNLVDTEKMLGLLNGRGITFTDDETEADVILVNTCCFIGDAKEESVNTILDMARYKEEGNLKALLVVTGCSRRDILDDYPVSGVEVRLDWSGVTPSSCNWRIISIRLRTISPNV